MEGFGEYIRKLRMDQKLSLRDVAASTGISVSYLTQIEHGRRGVPGVPILKRMAPLYKVPLRELLRSAGYLEEQPSGLSDEAEVNRAFEFAMSDPRYESGTRISGPITTDVKRFIVEMYEKSTGKKLLPGG
ncbi:MAG: helix-turn-helix domain-containing protein [bacterium]|nr:helix-turn-helix domain-containing protein [bacterium]